MVSPLPRLQLQVQVNPGKSVTEAGNGKTQSHYRNF